MMATARQRLDEALVSRSLVETRAKTRAMVMAGDVLVDGQVAVAAGKPVGEHQEIALREKQRFVSRGGEKLDHALNEFAINPAGLVCADFGASTGGFTDCLLQRDAARVYGIDVGYGQLHERIRRDQRVVVMEKCNVRLLESLPEAIDLVVIDVSFISLRLVLPAAIRVLRPGGTVVPLIKPQFEAGRSEVGKGGVVRESEVHIKVLRSVLGDAQSIGLAPVGLTRSPITGPAGNIEFLAHLMLGGESTPIDRMLAAAGFDHAPV